MKTIVTTNINRIIEVFLMALVIYSTLSILRSLALLYLAYTDYYFYNFDFAKELYIKKSVAFNNAYYFFTYLAGLIFSLFLNRLIKSNWLYFLLSLIFGFILFRLIDSEFIRPLFSFFKNPRMNIILHTIIFLIFGAFLLGFLKKTRVY